MKLKERIDAMVQLGDRLQQEDEYLEALMHRTHFHNNWLTIENQKMAIEAIANKFLDRKKLGEWLEKYDIPEETVPRRVGLVMAGNIPLVGFHDLLCVFVVGHKAHIKLSDKDQYLMPYLVKLLKEIDPATEPYFNVQVRLKDFEAVIATGSNNSSRYFEAYFGRYPHIIRKNRNGVAVLTGEESKEELKDLGEDIFRYYGLGCRNVSKIYVPEGYDFDHLLEELHQFKDMIRHPKFKNNFDHHYAIYILNGTKYLNNGCLVMTENSSLQSKIAELHYEYYKDIQEVEKGIVERKEEIQCVIANDGVLSQKTFPFGKAQEPELWDYADGVDTMEFLLGLE